MIRAIVSDFGGVLTTPIFQAFAAYNERVGVSLEEIGTAMARATEAADGRHPLFELEKGLLSEEAFVAALQAQLPGDTKLETMREVWFENLHPNDEMIAYMRELRASGMRTALLTNNVREWEPLWRAKLPDVDEIFEVVVDSAFVGMRKPEAEIYELTLERLGGVAAFECVFVDDLDVNCDAARALGMHAVHFRETSQAIEEIEAAVGRKKRETRT